jgi:hypothetical protein
MTEPIEKWKDEFESSVKLTKEYMNAMDFIKPHIFDVDENGKYKKSDTETLWQGFLMAKRSQPVVELPIALTLDAQFYFIELCQHLRGKGINYRIKGE